MREFKILFVFRCVLQNTPASIWSNFFQSQFDHSWTLHSFSISGWIRVGFWLSPLCRCQHNALSFLILYQFQTLFSGVSSEHTSRFSTLEIIIPRSLTGREKHPPFSHEVCYSDFLFFLIVDAVLHYTHTQNGWYIEIFVMKCSPHSLFWFLVFSTTFK